MGEKFKSVFYFFGLIGVTMIICYDVSYSFVSRRLDKWLLFTNIRIIHITYTYIIYVCNLKWSYNPLFVHSLLWPVHLLHTFCEWIISVRLCYDVFIFVETEKDISEKKTNKYRRERVCVNGICYYVIITDSNNARNLQQTKSLWIITDSTLRLFSFAILL